ncbi:GntR family transcriptional regulator [Lactonifactor longoviformis]|uniref:DNA-binding transcriptional regulator, FadR family n=1 Tax=Lactonifactor longoviformis DSM 17459 TaxID=1122155 RepID=A0A1M5BYJ9_9CLOT|nr:GntR family transcriptional regulator [Lactonifactor longoviformis]POP33631.1 GntR family transcriptional regulator [Lactonifactor longoviformis]SHF47539.1 DNA-binding transcriptional regulator, FadR family [Lactonifactor longoviformis DSM 17459]
MKYDKFQYDRIFEILKNKIETGRMPKGSVLPSYTELCREYKVSNKTIRRVVAMLSDAGLIETKERQPSLVIFDQETGERHSADNLKEPNVPVMTDILKTAEILCYPLICRGISLCSKSDWDIPERIARQLDPELPKLFWKNSKLFWRFFIARCENELSLHTVDCLGFLELEYRENNFDSRIAYQKALIDFTAKSRKATPASDAIKDFLTDIHRITISREDFACYVPADSPFRIGVQGLDKWMKTAEERYSSVYLDILGLISIGYYQPGDRLPSHARMQKQYGVSVNTTTQAVRCLQDWGIVEATPGKGIFVSTDVQTLHDIYVDPKLIASHIRRFIECLELLSLTAEGTAYHVAGHVSFEQMQDLLRKLEEAKKIGNLYQPAPIVLLEFLTEHIPYEALQSVYTVILRNYRMGRKIPKLVNSGNASKKLALHRKCTEAAEALLRGERSAFAKQAAEMFWYTHQLTIEECKRLDYWKTVKSIYDGSELWK